MSAPNPADLWWRHLGDRIRDAREEAGLSQERLGRAVELSRSSICNVEFGRQHVSAWHLLLIAMALDTTPDRLLGITDPAREAGQR